MKSIKCFVLLGLLVASASAAPGLIDSIVDTIARPLTGSLAQSSAQSRSLGGSFGLGPFSIGGNLNGASSRAFSSGSATNSGNYEPSYRSDYVPEPVYRGIGGSHAAASAQSEVNSLGGGIGFGPFRIGGNFNTAGAHASASAVNNNYNRSPYDPVYVPEFGSVAEAHAQADASIAENQRDYRRYY